MTHYYDVFLYNFSNEFTIGCVFKNSSQTYPLFRAFKIQMKYMSEENLLASFFLIQIVNFVVIVDTTIRSLKYDHPRIGRYVFSSLRSALHDVVMRNNHIPRVRHAISARQTIGSGGGKRQCEGQNGGRCDATRGRVPPFSLGLERGRDRAPWAARRQRPCRLYSQGAGGRPLAKLRGVCSFHGSITSTSLLLLVASTLFSSASIVKIDRYRG